MTSLFDPVTLGPLTLRNRMVMAAMTRNRAGEGLAPTDLVVKYYTQRAGAGLIVTEGSQVSPQGIGYPNTPGIHTREQVEAWKRVTEAVHARGGAIFLQLWHVGRISHPSLQPGAALPVAPSAIAPVGTIYTPAGPQPFVTPRALETAEIPAVIDQFRHGAAAALEAGFDGVELHGANGYLLDQFLQDGTNRRTDEYGGSVANRARLLLEVTAAAVEVWGTGRVGVRLSPTSTFNDMRDSNPAETFGFAAQALDRLGLAYLHVIDGEPLRVGGRELSPTRYLRPRFTGRLITNGGYDGDRAQTALAAGDADLVSFGRLFLANPDLPRRLALGAPLNTPDRDTFYGGGAKGYIDYPALAG